MKHLTLLFTFSLFIFTSSAALPIHWDVELAAQPPQVFTLQRPRGETYELEAVLKNRGKPFEPAITNACIYWQTNGMENLYWSAPASVSNNFLRASWLPSMDPGATTVRGYIGDPGHIYAAAFQFRFIASPGALPNELPLPTPVIDFAKVTVLNPPWSGGGGGGVDTNAVIDIVLETLATNGLRRVDDLKVWRLGYSADGPWAWESASSDLKQTLNTRGVKPTWNGSEWTSPDIGIWEMTQGDSSEEDVGSVTVYYKRLDEYDEVEATATRIRVYVESGDIAFTREQGNDRLVKLSSGGELVYAEEDVDYYTPESVDYKIENHHDETKQDALTSAQLANIADVTNKADRSELPDMADQFFYPGWVSGAEQSYASYWAYGAFDDEGFEELSWQEVVERYATPLISTNNPAFVSAVRSLMPTTLRAYDPVRQCWWNIKPVNGVLTLTVED